MDAVVCEGEESAPTWRRRDDDARGKGKKACVTHPSASGTTSSASNTSSACLLQATQLQQLQLQIRSFVEEQSVAMQVTGESSGAYSQQAHPSQGGPR